MSKADPKSELLFGIGSCLDAWSSVELEIANLYMILHSVKRNEYSHPIRSAYESVISLEARLTMIKIYIEADMNLRHNHLMHFKVLNSRISNLHKKSHETAHFKIVARAGKPDIQYLSVLILRGVLLFPMTDQN